MCLRTTSSLVTWWLFTCVWHHAPAIKNDDLLTIKPKETKLSAIWIKLHKVISRKCIWNDTYKITSCTVTVIKKNGGQYVLTSICQVYSSSSMVQPLPYSLGQSFRPSKAEAEWVSQWMIKLNSLFADSGHRGQLRLEYSMLRSKAKCKHYISLA